jgi:ribosomal protein S12 methylthiotransferase
LHIGEVLLGDLAKHGFKITEEIEEADCIVVNTCAFVEEAKTESLEVCLDCTESYRCCCTGAKKARCLATEFVKLAIMGHRPYWKPRS